MSKKKKVVAWIFAVFLALAACGCVFVCLTVIAAPILNEEDVTPDGYLTSVLDDSGNVMTSLAGTEANRVYVTLDQIPENLQNAFIAIEDERFYEHGGIDLIGISRAFFKGITSFHFSQGASTITQQLIKNNVLTSWTEEETFFDKLQRKIQEQYLALKLESRESKEWILENYLNTINLGGGTWGVQAASKRYFGKNVSDLTLSESAVIAAITRSPSSYNPINYPQANKERMTLVLGNMLKQGYITEEAYEEAVADDVFERIATTHSDNSAETLSYFEDAMIKSIVTDLVWQLGYTEDEAWDAVYRGGLTINTTQNTDLQAICEEEVNNENLYSDSQQVSVVVIDQSTGGVMAMVGGRGPKDSSLVYNRATDSIRQPGSTIKVIGEYAAILDSGAATLGTVVDDAPYTYSDGTEIQNASGTYPGMTTIRNAIAGSSNIVALKTYQNVGSDTVMSYLEDFGITTLTDEDDHEALAIGGTYNGVTNLELTAAYNAINAGGTYTEPYYYTEVLDHDGNVLLSHEPETTQVIEENTACLLTQAMMSVFDYGTGKDAAFSGLPIAGKTGTTNDGKDAWLVGYSPYFTCGVWGGYDDNSPQENTDYVKILWKNIMQRATSDYKYKDFELTSDITTATICTKCGNLAVEGLCDHTEQGNMTATEYFVSGTEPTKKCTCHKKVTVCADSGLPDTFYCPDSSVVTKVYLTGATEGTLDEAYVAPSFGGQKCTTHTSMWDKYFEDDADDRDSGSGSGDGGGGSNPFGSDWKQYVDDYSDYIDKYDDFYKQYDQYSDSWWF